MSRTPEQTAMDELLTEALSTALDFYDDEPDPSLVLTDYLVIATRQKVDENGEIETTRELIVSEGSTTMTNIIGLLEYSKAELLRSMLD
jgi:hypothetical protein